MRALAGITVWLLASAALPGAAHPQAGFPPADPSPHAAACPVGGARCIALFPAADFPAASGSVALTPSASPFGASVGPDGTQRWDLELRAEGLPPPRTLGPYAAYVAWAAPPVLEPMVRLGTFEGGALSAGRVTLDKFFVLVSAEPHPSGARPSGPVVLRGTSPSMALQPHELPAMLSVAAGGLRGPAHHPAG
ncbi:MAG TPA: hypothetical protein VM737_03395, partial [Gemmatimonadota bacterium]|nr:hypothetical protein [Gemmatimonadota bacterium]